MPHRKSCVTPGNGQARNARRGRITGECFCARQLVVLSSKLNSFERMGDIGEPEPRWRRSLRAKEKIAEQVFCRRPNLRFCQAAKDDRRPFPVRYPTKPRPAKPRSNIAQVDGSGVLITGVIVPVNVPEPSKVSVVAKSVALFGSNPTLLAIPRISNSLTPPAPKLNIVSGSRVVS